MLKKILLSSIFYLLTANYCYAAGLTVYPAYQEILASDSATITYTNETNQPIILDFSLQKIIATDLLGRLQFNAPLPQTIQATDPNLSVINPNELIINPGETASISAQFNPNLLNPGTTAFLLLAQINTPSLSPPNLGGDASGGNSSANLTQYLGSSILVTALGGHTTKLELIKTSLTSFPLHFAPPDFLQLTLRNSGNTRSIPKGVVITKDLFDREVMRGAINSDSVAILPGSQRLIYTHLQPSLPNWPISIHRLTLTGSDDVGQSHFSYTKTYLYLNPFFLSGIIAICVIFFITKKKK